MLTKYCGNSLRNPALVRTVFTAAATSNTSKPRSRKVKQPQQFIDSELMLQSVSEVVAKEMRSNLLVDRTCMITNCKSQEGYLPYNIAKSLADFGANIVIHSKSEDEASAILSELPVRHSAQSHKSVHGDILNSENITAQLESITDKLDTLIHSTGAEDTQNFEDVLNFPVEEFEKVIDMNLKSPFVLTKTILPFLRRGYRPSIVFSSNDIDSKKKMDAYELGGAYYVNKFSIRSCSMLASMLSQQLDAERIRVNAVDTGRMWMFDQSQSTMDLGDFTSCFVWLAREDTELTGATVDAKDWLRRDPTMFKRIY